MLYRCTEDYIFYIDNDAEVEEYRHLKDTLENSNVQYDEVVDSNYVVITLKKPNWRMV